MATVTYEHVTKKFGDVSAVKDLNLQVRDEEFLVLVGPSGCGKTTALRMLAGLEEQTSGDILIGERRVNDVAPKDRDIAMVFQNYALYPHMSVYDNIAFGLKLRGVDRKEIERRVNEVAEMLSIGQLLKRKPKELSGGQRQRVAVGRAIAREPAVFLMDEPLSNLDAKLRIQTRAMLQKLHQRLLRTTIYVDARSGRGDDDGRPHRRDERGRAPAAGHAREPSRASGESLRRGFHRIPVDELLRREDRRAALAARSPTPASSKRR